METVEIVVYLIVALALGVLVLQLVTTWDYHKTFESVKRVFTKERTIEFKTVDMEGFTAELFTLWQSCGFGEVDKSHTIYVDDQGDITKDIIFQQIIKLNLCDSLQSNAYDCGQAEHVNDFSAITLPHVVRIECDSLSGKLTIVGG